MKVTKILVGSIISNLIVSAFVALIINWYVMLIVGVVHFQLLPAVIPAGYWACYPISYIITIPLTGSLRN